MAIHESIRVEVQDNAVVCTIARPSKKASALWGTTRALIANMVLGVTAGYRKQLELHGVGYRARLQGSILELQVGFSHPVNIEAPAGIVFTVDKEVITVAGIDRQAVGAIAAKIRAVRKPEPYQGKGIRYVGEVVRRKVGKVVGVTGT